MSGHSVVAAGPSVVPTGGITDWPRPLAFVFGAGIARAAAQVGMLEVLFECGIQPDLVVGSSWGAVNAAAVATAVDSAGSEAPARLRAFWLNLATDRSWTSRFRGVIRAVTPGRSEGSAEILREHLESLLADARLDDAPVRVCCVATDLVAGRAVELGTGSAVDAVIASAAVPLLLPTVTSGGQILADGGVVAPAPLRQAVALGARSVVHLDVGACGMTVEQAGDLRWYEVGIAAYSGLLHSRAEAEVSMIAERVPVATITIPAGDLMNFREAADLMATGRQAAERAISRLPDGVPAPGLYGLPKGEDPEPTQPVGTMSTDT